MNVPKFYWKQPGTEHGLIYDGKHWVAYDCIWCACRILEKEKGITVEKWPYNPSMVMIKKIVENTYGKEPVHKVYLHLCIIRKLHENKTVWSIGYKNINGITRRIQNVVWEEVDGKEKEKYTEYVKAVKMFMVADLPLVDVAFNELNG